jgi:UDP-2-acetamido-3-amino-2,3-dideoxy-glucuronate N-acetyltransferase
VLRPSDRAPGLLVGEDVKLPEGIEIGGNVIVHAGTVLREGVRLGDGCTVGKAPLLGPRSSASREPPGPAILEEGVSVGAGSVILAGARLGAGCLVADQAHVRERAEVGAGSLVGRGVAVDNDVRVGERVKLQTGAYITAWSLVEDDVFVAPGVTLTNDQTMGRRRAGDELRGAVLRRACRVGGGAVLLPGVEVGEEAFVAAGALVTRDVPARTLVMGVPARIVREVPHGELLP